MQLTKVAQRVSGQSAGLKARSVVKSPNVLSVHRANSNLQRHSIKTRAGLTQKVDGEQLEIEIQNRESHLIVDFYATWCGPCVLLATELEKVANKLGNKVKILKVDVDENPELSTMLKIEGLPTLVIVPKEGNKPALRAEGLLPADQIEQIVNQL